MKNTKFEITLVRVPTKDEEPTVGRNPAKKEHNFISVSEQVTKQKPSGFGSMSLALKKAGLVK